MTTGKTIALIRQTFAGEVMSLLFNMLTRLVIAFLPKSKCLGLISWLPSPSAVISEPKKIKPVTVSTDSPSICHEVMGPGAMIFIFFWMLSFKPAFSLSSSFQTDCPVFQISSLQHWIMSSFIHSLHSFTDKIFEDWPHSDILPSPEGSISKYGTIFDVKFPGLVGNTNAKH